MLLVNIVSIKLILRCMEGIYLTHFCLRTSCLGGKKVLLYSTIANVTLVAIEKVTWK